MVTRSHGSDDICTSPKFCKKQFSGDSPGVEPCLFPTAVVKNVYPFVRVSICNGNLRGAALQSRCVPLTRTRQSEARQSARVLFRRLTSSRLLLERDFFSAFKGELYASFALNKRQDHETDCRERTTAGCERHNNSGLERLVGSM